MPLDKFQKLCALLSPEEHQKFLAAIGKKSANWGQVIGGKKTLLRHPEILKKGRKKALRINSKPKYDFDINLKLSPKMAEFVGAFIGDGFTAKYQSGGKFIYMTQFTGDSRFDTGYYKNVICPTAQRNFNYKKDNMKSKKNVLRVNFYSKRLFEFLTVRLNLPSGKKSSTVLIPNEIFGSNKLAVKCIRGIFDTDGCVFFDKRPAYKAPYARISLKMFNPPLIDQIFSKLCELKLSAEKLGTGKEIQIIGPKNVKLFLTKIGFSNDRHFQKLKNAGLA